MEGVLSEGVLSKGVLSGGGFVRAPIVHMNMYVIFFLGQRRLNKLIISDCFHVFFEVRV